MRRRLLESRVRTRLLAAAVPVALFLASPAGAWAISTNPDYQPQTEFELQPWVDLKVPTPIGQIDFSITKAVMYLWLSAAATVITLVWVGRRMQAKPNRVQTAVEAAYDLTNNQMTRANMDARMSARWFAFIATIFFFIFWANVIGYVPLPINTEHPIDVFGLFQLPTFQIYAATANLSMPLILTLVVWFAYHIQGIVRKGPIQYVKSLMPEGVEGFARYPIGALEVFSHFIRIVSLSARLFANLLAGHLLILLMAGGLIVLLSVSALAVVTIPVGVLFYMFEAGLIAGLQAFIFAILSAIYLGEATAEAH